jgi:hypothetical protein
MSIWYDNIIAATVIHHLYDIKHPAFHKLRLLNRTWYYAFSAMFPPGRDLAITVLKCILQFGYPMMYRFHPDVLRVCTKHCLKYNYNYEYCFDFDRQAQYTVKFRIMDFIINMMRAKNIENPEYLRWLRMALLSTIWYNYLDVFNNILRGCGISKKLIYREPVIVKHIARLSRVEFIYRINSSIMSIYSFTNVMDMHDDAKCLTKERDQILTLHAMYCITTISKFVYWHMTCMDFTKCHDALLQIKKFTKIRIIHAPEPSELYMCNLRELLRMDMIHDRLNWCGSLNFCELCEHLMHSQ